MEEITLVLETLTGTAGCIAKARLVILQHYQLGKHF